MLNIAHTKHTTEIEKERTKTTTATETTRDEIISALFYFLSKTTLFWFFISIPFTSFPFAKKIFSCFAPDQIMVCTHRHTAVQTQKRLFEKRISIMCTFFVLLQWKISAILYLWNLPLLEGNKKVYCVFISFKTYNVLSVFQIMRLDGTI